ncbi:MAG: hypothetical protein LRZ97_01935 [Candidatus Pacebacteria bacterium]|nr:hypothetical protein [Candidatus Paceibacterota bacterium]
MPEKPKHTVGGMSPEARDRIKHDLSTALKKLNEPVTAQGNTQDPPSTQDAREHPFIKRLTENKRAEIHKFADTIHSPKKSGEEAPITNIDQLINDPTLEVPDVYGDTPMGVKREQILKDYILKYNERYISKIINSKEDILTVEQIQNMRDVSARYARLTTYIKEHHKDDYEASVEPLSAALTSQLEQIAHSHISNRVLHESAISIIYQGGSAGLFASKKKILANTLDISSPTDESIAAETGANVMLNNIEQMRRGALLWYYQKLTGDNRATIPEGVTLQSLLNDKYSKVIDMQRAAVHAALPIGGAFVGGVLTGGGAAPLWGHLAASAAGGAAGLVGSALWNKRGKSGSRLYDAQLLSALHNFNKRLDEEAGIYIQKPAIGKIRETLRLLKLEAPQRGVVHHELSLSNLKYLLDQNVKGSKERQKKTYAALAVGSIAVNSWLHTLGAAPPSVTTPPIVAATSVSTPVAPTSSWGSFTDFWKFNGIMGSKFNMPTLGYCEPIYCP